MLMRLSSFMALVFVVALMVSAPAAYADAKCQLDDSTGDCAFGDSDPGGSSDGSNGDSRDRSETHHGDDSRPPACINTGTKPATTIPCVTELGSWLNDRQCYVITLDDPPPPADDPRWFGQTGGAIYECMEIPPKFGGMWFWSATSPLGTTTADPEVLARRALATMALRAVEIGLAPKPNPDAVSLVQLPVWMWVSKPTATTWGPITRSATDRGLTVSATARVDYVDWDMGDGATVRCSKGTPRPAGGGSNASPDCGHIYTGPSAAQRHGVFAIAATSHWTIHWSGGGQTGTLTLDLTSRSQLRIVESRPVLTAP